jgi:NADPH:quinone reductase-like Zn-dependent oxidoreductase
LEGLGADIVIKDTDLTDRDTVKEITAQAKNIRLALNCVGGKATTNMLKLLGTDAYIITYGAMAREPLILPATPLLFKGLTAKGFWVSKWHQDNPEERKKELAWLCEHIQNGELKGVDHEEVHWAGKEVDEETGWARVQDALKKMREGRSGKKMVLVNYDQEDIQ